MLPTVPPGLPGVRQRLPNGKTQRHVLRRGEDPPHGDGEEGPRRQPRRADNGGLGRQRVRAVGDSGRAGPPLGERPERGPRRGRGRTVAARDEVRAGAGRAEGQRPEGGVDRLEDGLGQVGDS